MLILEYLMLMVMVMKSDLGWLHWLMSSMLMAMAMVMNDDDVGFEVADVFIIHSSTARFSPILKPSSTKSVSFRRRSCRSVISCSAQDYA